MHQTLVVIRFHETLLFYCCARSFCWCMHATLNTSKVHVARRVHVSSYTVIATILAKAPFLIYDLAIVHPSSYVFFLCQYLLMLLTCKGAMICSLPSFNLVAKVLRDPTWAMPFCVHLRFKCYNQSWMCVLFVQWCSS
jgi:hypothetical protein